MAITVRLSQHARSDRHFNDPRRVLGTAYRMARQVVQQLVPVQVQVQLQDGSRGTAMVYQLQNVAVDVPVPYTTYVVYGTTTPWDDSLLSSHNGVTYFPANETQHGVETYVLNSMRNYLTKGKAAGTHDLEVGTYKIRVAWLPDDSSDADNEGFTISQMYPH